MILYAWLIAAVAAVYLYFRQIYSRFSKYGVKNEPIIPVVGNMAPMLRRQKHRTEVFQDTYDEFPNERFVGRYEFMKPLILIRDIELLKKIGVKDFEYFLDHGMSNQKDIDPLFSRTLFSLAGQEWKDMRATLSPAFTSSKMRHMVPFMEEVGDQMLRSLKKQINESNKGYIDVECMDIATRHANDVIASCAYGLYVDSHTEPSNEFYKMGTLTSNFTFKQMLKIFGHGAFPWLMKELGITLFSESTRAFFKRLVLETMSDREAHGTLRPDMIHLLMEAKKGRLTHDSGKDTDVGFATVEESDVGKKAVNRVWTDNDLAAQALVFFLAGYKTVSTALTFFMYELALNPEIQDKLLQEIREHAKKSGGKLDYTSIQNMTYMDMVVSEVLRKWPPAIATDRLCVMDYNMGRPNDEATCDYIIKKGEIVSIPITSIHRDPRYYPDPWKFDPERFSNENKHNIKPMTFIPFGVGPRNCIGSRFALCEVKVMIYQLLLNIELSPCEKTPTDIPPILAKNTFNLKLLGGHHLRMKLRK